MLDLGKLAGEMQRKANGLNHLYLKTTVRSICPVYLRNFPQNICKSFCLSSTIYRRIKNTFKRLGVVGVGGRGEYPLTEKQMYMDGSNHFSLKTT